MIYFIATRDRGAQRADWEFEIAFSAGDTV
jgi:hypothetical protein